MSTTVTATVESTLTPSIKCMTISQDKPKRKYTRKTKSDEAK
jgi:hypothetical protein